MTREEMIGAVEEEIVRLEKIRELLCGSAARQIGRTGVGTAAAGKHRRNARIHTARTRARRNRWAGR